MMYLRECHIASMLTDGKVLVVGYTDVKPTDKL